MIILAVYALLILNLVLQAVWYVVPTDYKTVVINVYVLHCLYIQNGQVFLILLLGVIVRHLTQIVFDLLIFQLSLVIYLVSQGALAYVVRESFVAGVKLGLSSLIVS